MNVEIKKGVLKVVFVFEIFFFKWKGDEEWVDGVLILYKLVGLILYDCVFKVWKLFCIKKVGYIGILDSDVIGVLFICIGRVIKIVEYLIGVIKIYEGEVIFGFFIIIEDFFGEVVEEKKVVDFFLCV